jgi:GT2 family glycosyltransferase
MQYGASVSTELSDQHVTAIIVSHDGVTWLSEVVAALSSQKLKLDEIIAVDNGSIDGSPKLLRNAGIKVIEQKRDAGFGSAIATAVASLPKLKIAADGECNEWLWILHDDCAPDRRALKILLTAALERPQVGIAGPKILGWYDRKHILEVGVSITENGSRWTGLEEREHDQGQHDDTKIVLAVSTAGMLIKRSLYEELGGFDPSLELFRDDIDFGWRAHIAGYSVICVGEAILYHAEAAASERRIVDVRDALLHRPLLLDRRNAAFVLLANSSRWILPWVAIQLLFTAIGRSIIYLLAKLPGYAADEIAAIALLIFKPADLIKSRRYRKEGKYLSARVIKPFIPSRSVRYRLTLERISSSIFNAFKFGKNQDEAIVSKSYSDIGVIDESFDELQFLPTQSFTKLRSLVKLPMLFGFLITIGISILYSRNRFGSLAGGALAVAPDSAMDLIRRYVDSWHLVGLGSSAAVPTWLPLIAIGSALTLGNPQTFLTLIFFLTPTICFLIFYRTANKFKLGKYSSFIAALLYSFSPVVLTSINQGRIGTIAIAFILPILFTLFIKDQSVGEFSIRRLAMIALVAGVAVAFSPLFAITWILLQLGFIIKDYFTDSGMWKKIELDAILKHLSNSRTKNRLILTFAPIAMNIPWAFSFIFHPLRGLVEPGLSVESAGFSSVLLFNPGGATSPAWFLIPPFLLFLIASVISPEHRDYGLIGILTIFFAATLSNYYVIGNGSAAQRIWTGAIILFAQLLALLAAFTLFEKLIPILRSTSIGYRHFLSVVTATATAVAILIFPIWAATTGANSLVRANQELVIPAFITDLAGTESKPKTLVMRKNVEQLQYFITRGGDLQIGDPDMSSATPGDVKIAISDLVSGTGATASQVLGSYGIQYIFIKNPADPALIRTVDGIGGFTRSSETKDGVIWKVNNANARITLVDGNGQKFSLASNDKSSNAYAAKPGTILLAEKYDDAWKLLLNGRNINLVKSEFGIPAFVIDMPGDISLIHDGSARRGWVSLQLIAVLTLIVLALPAGRKRKEVPLEELV